MPVVKISVSVREDLYRQLQDELAESPGGVSAVVNEALEQHFRRQAGLLAVQEVWDEIGAPSAEDRRALDERYRAAGMPDRVRGRGAEQ